MRHFDQRIASSKVTYFLTKLEELTPSFFERKRKVNAFVDALQSKGLQIPQFIGVFTQGDEIRVQKMPAFLVEFQQLSRSDDQFAIHSPKGRLIMHWLDSIPVNDSTKARNNCEEYANVFINQLNIYKSQMKLAKFSPVQRTFQKISNLPVMKLADEYEIVLY